MKVQFSKQLNKKCDEMFANDGASFIIDEAFAFIDPEDSDAVETAFMDGLRAAKLLVDFPQMKFYCYDMNDTWVIFADTKVSEVLKRLDLYEF